MYGNIRIARRRMEGLLIDIVHWTLKIREKIPISFHTKITWENNKHWLNSVLFDFTVLFLFTLSAFLFSLKSFRGTLVNFSTNLCRRLSWVHIYVCMYHKYIDIYKYDYHFGDIRFFSNFIFITANGTVSNFRSLTALCVTLFDKLHETLVKVAHSYVDIRDICDRYFLRAKLSQSLSQRSRSQ